MLDTVKIAEVSVQHITKQDWELCQSFATKSHTLSKECSEAYVDFEWFAPNYSVRLSLGRVFASREVDSALDYDVWGLLRESGLSIHLADIVLTARREDFIYLILDPEKEATAELPVHYKDD